MFYFNKMFTLHKTFPGIHSLLILAHSKNSRVFYSPPPPSKLGFDPHPPQPTPWAALLKMSTAKFKALRGCPLTWPLHNIHTLLQTLLTLGRNLPGFLPSLQLLLSPLTAGSLPALLLFPSFHFSGHIPAFRAFGETLPECLSHPPPPSDFRSQNQRYLLRRPFLSTTPLRLLSFNTVQSTNHQVTHI